VPPSDAERPLTDNFPQGFRQVFDLVPEAVIEIDASGRIVFANSKVEEVFGYQPSELLNQKVEILIPPDLRRGHAERREAFAEEPKNRQMGSRVEFAGLRKDGVRFPADIALNPVPFEDHSHILAFVRDVTHLRSLEMAERELLNKTLLGMASMLDSLTSLTSPLIFARTQSIRSLVSHMAREFGSAEIWQFQLAASLCLIGCTVVPPSVFEKAWMGEALSEEEDRMFRSHPAIGRSLLSSIPRLENVAEIIGQQQSIPTAGGSIETGVRMLRLAQQADQWLYQGKSFASILPRLRIHGNSGLVDSLSSYAPPKEVYLLKALSVSELQPGMTLEEDLRTDNGLLIALKDARIDVTLLERIRNFTRMAGIHKRIQVRCPA
jgi:PAS domain S-box-containing protein